MNQWLRRLRRLERLQGPCPSCMDQPAQVLIAHGKHEPCPEGPAPCPACGRSPEVVEVVEVLVRNREEAEAFLRGEALKKRGRMRP
jgi:hypothetical protein